MLVESPVRRKLFARQCNVPMKESPSINLAQRAAIQSFKAAGCVSLTAARMSAKGLARLAYGLNGRSVQVTRRNLALCFPSMSEKSREALVKQSVYQTAMFALELPLVWRKDQAWFDRHVWHREGYQLFEDARKEQRGLLILAPHTGNWEIVGLSLARWVGEDYACLYQPPRLPWVESFMKGARARFGGESLPTNRRGLIKLSQHIKQGGLTGILPDQVPDRSGGIVSSFYQHPCFTMTLAHSIIKRTECRVLGMAAIRDEKGFGLVVKECDPAIYSNEVDESVAAMNRVVEALVDIDRSQYQWEYKRFKGLGRKPSLYADLD